MITYNTRSTYGNSLFCVRDSPILSENVKSDETRGRLGGHMLFFGKNPSFVSQIRNFTILEKI